MMGARPEILREAATVINTGGLHKKWYQHGAAHCTVGALMAASGVQFNGNRELDSVHTVEPEIELLAELLGDIIGYSQSAQGVVYKWNDEPERAADDVITLLEQAAEKAEADR